MTTKDFCTLLEAHDWAFAQIKYLARHRYEQGLRSQKRLLYLCQEQPELFRLYNYAENCIIRSLPFDFPSVAGTTPVKDETQQHNTHANTPMKDLLQSIFEALIKPLIDAIDRNTASKGGCSAPALEPAAPAPVAAEKPAKAPKGAKAAPAPAPEPEPEEAAPAISEARLVATVKTLPKEGKIKLKEYFTKKFGYNTMAEIAEENRNDIHAAAVKIGATDTDPEASDEVEGM